MKVFLYCRVAHNDGFSLEAQERELRFHAAQFGYTIIGAAAEHGSGLTLDRPALQKVTQAVQSDKVELVLVMSIDRIGREWGTTQRYIDLLTEHRAKLLCIKERCLFSDKGVVYF
ncbi:MAG: recombinase family protein [Oscillospiraceae bacterium]